MFMSIGYVNHFILLGYLIMDIQVLKSLLIMWKNPGKLASWKITFLGQPAISHVNIQYNSGLNNI